MLLTSKYGFDFSKQSMEQNIRRLTNQLWKLIPMKENNEDWERQLETVLIEIAGLHEIFMDSRFLQLLSKLEGLRLSDITFELHRKTVFEAISLLQELNRGIRV